MVFKLQQDVGTATIEAKEKDFRTRALARWRDNPAIEVLGNTDNDSLAIFSLRLKCDTITGRRDLHYGFVVALLNDLFGIQARGGCSCAGPYGHDLLNMDMRTSRAIEKEIKKGHMVLRPGWVRLNFNYFIDESTFAYLLSAIELIAEYGARLLPFYEFDSSSATWRYQGREMQLGTALCDFDFLTDQSLPQQSRRRQSLHLKQAAIFRAFCHWRETNSPASIEMGPAIRFHYPQASRHCGGLPYPRRLPDAGSSESRVAG